GGASSAGGAVWTSVILHSSQHATQRLPDQLELVAQSQQILIDLMKDPAHLAAEEPERSPDGDRIARLQGSFQLRGRFAEPRRPARLFSSEEGLRHRPQILPGDNHFAHILVEQRLYPPKLVVDGLESIVVIDQCLQALIEPRHRLDADLELLHLVT